MTDVLYLVQGRQLLCDWLFKVHDCSSYVTLYGSTSTTQKSRRVQWNSTKSSTVPCTNLFTLISLMQISGKQRPVLSLAFFRCVLKVAFFFFFKHLIQCTGWCSPLLHHWSSGGPWLSTQCGGELRCGGFCGDVRGLHPWICWNWQVNNTLRVSTYIFIFQC